MSARRKPFFLLLAADLAIGGTVSIGDTEGQTGPAAWRIRAGPVAVTEGATPTVSGRFSVDMTDDAGLRQLPLNGGACLLADLVPFGIGREQCATNADCNGPAVFDTSLDAHFAEYSGYCIARDGSGEAPRCWTRPGPASTHCRRSIDGLVLSDGEFTLGPVEADPLGQAPRLPEWAVLACLAHPGFERACGEPASEHRQLSLTPAAAAE